MKWKEMFEKKWMVWACGPDEVYYVFESRGSHKFKWETLKNHNDVSDTLCFESKKEAEAFIQYCIINKKIPKDCNRFDYGAVYPNIEDGQYWYEEAGPVHEKLLKENKNARFR